MKTIQRILFYNFLVGTALGSSLSSAAEGVATNIIHPFYLYERTEAIAAAQKADCIIAVSQVPEVPGEGETFFEKYEPLLPEPCRKPYGQKLAETAEAEFATLADDERMNLQRLHDAQLKAMNLQPIRMGDERDIVLYARYNDELVTKLRDRYRSKSSRKNYRSVVSHVWANSFCPEIKEKKENSNTSDATGATGSAVDQTATRSTARNLQVTETPNCDIISDKGDQLFRRSLERMVYEVEVARGTITPKSNREDLELDLIRIHGMFIADIDHERFADKQGYHDDRGDCPKVPAGSQQSGATYTRQSSDLLFRFVRHCKRESDDQQSSPESHAQSPAEQADPSEVDSQTAALSYNDPNYRVFLAFEPGSSLTRPDGSGRERSFGTPRLSSFAPTRQITIALQELADATTDIKLRQDEFRWPSRFRLRLAKDPSEFLKPKTSEGAEVGIALNQETKKQDFSVDVAAGLSLFNEIDPKSDTCADTPAPLCNVRWSATPFAAWQRTQIRDRGESPTEVSRSRDTLFGGLQIGYEKISGVAEEHRHADYWRKPSWRAAIALEAITDGDFDAQVYRTSATLAPPLPDFVPQLGYRRRVRFGELFLTEHELRARGADSRGAITKCTSRTLCSLWFEWDGSFAIDNVEVDEAPFDLSTDDPVDRIELIEGTRFGYDLSIGVGARSPFAFSGDRPWLELKADFKKREAFEAGGSQVELLDTGLKYTDTHDGSLSFGIGYKRGEDLRLGDESEEWTFEIGLKH